MEGQQDRKKKDHKKGGNKNFANKFAYKEPEYFTTPITGFLITSNQNQEKNAVRDAYNFLNKYVENDYQREIDRVLDDLETENVQKKLKTENPNPAENQEEVKNENPEQGAPQLVVHQSTSALLEKELKSYSKETRLFYNVDTNCKGIIFIKVNPLFKDVLDVKKIANKICKDVRENLIPVSRFCFKAVPIQVATKASLEAFQETIKGILDKKFKPENPKKWVLHFKCRNNSKFVMKPFLDYLLENIGKEHSVDYKNPDYTIFLEINNHLMCISVLKKFNTFKSYSLQLPGSNPAQNPKKNKNPEETATPAVPKESLVGELEFDEAPEQKEENNNQQQQQNAEAPANKQEESDEDIPLV